ncbi:MAG: hypothetical protein GC137_06860 [Alphaproteobacteria bacterium]|nr:hypothetical protein [Alphaproteobacteria bacterium]
MGKRAYQTSQDSRLQTAINGLLQELKTLAPHPDAPNHNGPLFIKNSANYKVANDHDSTLGMMIAENFLGSAFTEAVSNISEEVESWAQEFESFDATAALDCYNEYMTDFQSDEKRNRIAAHGQGTLARMSGKTIAKAFNLRGQISNALQNFYNDMPKRMKIEEKLASLYKELNLLDSRQNVRKLQALP